MRTAFLMATICCFFFACKKDSTQTQSNVIIGGFTQRLRNNVFVSYAKSWKNGISTDVTDGTKWVFINDMAVDGDNIYLVGHEHPIGGGAWTAKYWKNGIGYDLSDSINAEATAIAVAGSNVYVAGDSRDASQNFLWENGNLTITPTPLTKLYASGSDVYMSGFFYYGKDGSMSTVQDQQGAVINSITVSGNDIYCAGSSGNVSPSAGASSFVTATYWVNGESHYVGTGNINSIAVKGNDIYMVGYLSSGVGLGGSSNFQSVPTYWKNGTAHSLANAASAYGIAVDRNNNVHIIGTNANGYPTYWRNGTVVPIPNTDSTDLFVSIHAD